MISELPILIVLNILGLLVISYIINDLNRKKERKMEKPELQWTTTHTDDRMEHDFGNGFTIVVDKNINMGYKMKDNEVKDSFTTIGLLPDPYTAMLVNFAKSVQ